MKEMIKRVRDEKGGFTLAELLIVVAIILVLVAIAIPVFTGALTNAEKATGDANIRAVRATAATEILLDSNTYMSSDYSGPWTATATVSGSGDISEVTITRADGADKAEKNGDAWNVTAVINEAEVKAGA